MLWRGKCLYDRPRKGRRAANCSHKKWTRRARLRGWRRKQGLPVEQRLD
jgi:hypothetical protein